MNIIGIIPARLAATRFPNKPLANILGMPMVGHCYIRSKMCKSLAEVYVATCDQEVVDYIESIGGKAIMTADTHERASDRCAEALLTIEKQTGKRVDMMVMIQGDEPMITPEMIDLAVEPLIKDETILISNLMEDLKTVEEFEDPNEIKVVVDKQSFALYFSRNPIPSKAKWKGEIPMYKQVCIIPFRRDFLLEYNQMPQTPLEQIESVDMMRLLENGLKVKMIYTPHITFSVDTLENLEVVNQEMQKDSLVKTYLK